MEYVKVAQVSELGSGAKKKVSVGGNEVLLANIEGSFYAIDNTCPHMGGSLYEGKLEGTNVICPRHGSVFDVTNGKVVERGTLFLIKVKVHDLKSYPVKVEGADIMIGVE
ncbi:MAG: Rieske 2Fe-2S domain-containing protein [Actinobacteria bacterium]|nr:Rieske 2Fe-2S domain-containing protein [Actinomycetota bacterium]